MSTLSDRLREATRDVVTGEKLLPGMFGHAPIEDLEEAADELDRLTAELDLYKKSAAFCKEHQPNGGQRGRCLVCACQNLNAALSRISYLCGPPNGMGASPYDVDCDETAVVARVERLTARVAQDFELLRWAYSKLVYRSFDNMDDALAMDEIKLLLMGALESKHD